MLVVTVLAVIRAVQVFDQVWVLTGGGPGTATTYIVQYIYETGFANQIQTIWPCLGGIGGVGACVATLYPGTTAPRPKFGLGVRSSPRWNQPGRNRPCLPLSATILHAHAEAKQLHWTDIFTYLYLTLGTLLMFLPVVWLVFSSFKTPAALVRFPPDLLPYDVESVVVPGYDDPLPLVYGDPGRWQYTPTGSGATRRARSADDRPQCA